MCKGQRSNTRCLEYYEKTYGNRTEHYFTPLLLVNMIYGQLILELSKWGSVYLSKILGMVFGFLLLLLLLPSMNKDALKKRQIIGQ